jgi:hypothetical protein
MSDGHSDSVRWSSYVELKRKREIEEAQTKLDQMCLVLPNDTVIPLSGVQLLYSEKYHNDLKQAPVEMLDNDGSRMLNFQELVRIMIEKNLI